MFSSTSEYDSGGPWRASRLIKESGVSLASIHRNGKEMVKEFGLTEERREKQPFLCVDQASSSFSKPLSVLDNLGGNFLSGVQADGETQRECEPGEEMKGELLDGLEVVPMVDECSIEAPWIFTYE